MDPERFIKLVKDSVTAHLQTGCAELSIYRSYMDGDFVCREKHRDFKQSVRMPYAATAVVAEAMGRELARTIDNFDKANFTKWEIIPDPSQHSIMDEDGLVKRAGGTPKYVYRKGQYGLLKGMPEPLAMVYDDWLYRQGTATSVNGKSWDGDRWRDFDQEQGWKEAKDAKSNVALKERAQQETMKQAAAERTAKLKRDREEAAQRKLHERDTFYQQATDFGLF